MFFAQYSLFNIRYWIFKPAMSDNLDRLKAALADRYTILEELGAGE